jgi:hypothetical protein
MALMNASSHHHRAGRLDRHGREGVLRRGRAEDEGLERGGGGRGGGGGDGHLRLGTGARIIMIVSIGTAIITRRPLRA